MATDDSMAEILADQHERNEKIIEELRMCPRCGGPHLLSGCPEMRGKWGVL